MLLILATIDDDVFSIVSIDQVAGTVSWPNASTLIPMYSAGSNHPWRPAEAIAARVSTRIGKLICEL
jgi:hypothetical protein